MNIFADSHLEVCDHDYYDNNILHNDVCNESVGEMLAVL